MDEELLNLLEEAYKQGATQDDLKSIESWYSTSKQPKPKEEAPYMKTYKGLFDQIAARKGQPVEPTPQPTQDISEAGQFLPEWLRPKDPNAPVKKTAGVFESGAKKLANVFVNQIPEAVETSELIDQGSNLKDLRTRRGVGEYSELGALPSDKDFFLPKEELLKKAKEATQRGVSGLENERSKYAKKSLEILEQAYKVLPSDSNPELIKDYFTTKYNSFLANEIDQRVQKIHTQQQESQKLLKNVPQSTKEAGFSDNISGFVSGVVGEGLAQIPLSLLTRGGSSFLIEQSGIYNEALDAKAQMLSEQYGIPLTAADLKETGEDQDVTFLAKIFGTVNASLDRWGAGQVVKPFTKKLVERQVAKELTKRFGAGFINMSKSAGAEALTGFTQETNTQLATNLAKGMTLDEAFTNVDWSRSFEAGIQEGIGGAGVHTIAGGANQLKELLTPAKAAEQVQQQTKEVEIDKSIANVIQELSPEVETQVSTELDPLVADIKSLIAEQQLAATEEATTEETKAAEAPITITTTEETIQEDKPNAKEGGKSLRSTKQRRKKEVKQTIQSQTSSEEIPTNRVLQKTPEVNENNSTKQATTGSSPVQSSTQEAGINNTGEKVVTAAEEKPFAVNIEPTDGGYREKKYYRSGRIEVNEPKSKQAVTPTSEEAPIQATEEIKVEQPKIEATPTKKEKAPKTVKEVKGKGEAKVGGKLQRPVSKLSVEDEKIKLNDRLVGLTKLPRPSLRKQRLEDFINRVVPNSSNPEAHAEILEKAKKALEKETTKSEQKQEEKEVAKERSERKKVSKEEKVQADEPQEQDRGKDKKKEQQKQLDKLYTSVAVAVDSKNESIIDAAVKKLNDYRKQEGIKTKDGRIELDRDRIIEKSQAELYQIKKKSRSKLKDQGLDDDTIQALESPDEIQQISVRDINIPDSDKEANIERHWSELNEHTISDFSNKIKEELKNTNNFTSDIWSNIIDGMLDVIRRSAGNLRIFEGKNTPYNSDKKTLGEAVRSEGKMFIFLNKDRDGLLKNTVALHELTHIFEFALNQLENPTDPIASNSFKRINDLFESADAYILKNILKLNSKIAEYGIDSLTDSEKIFNTLANHTGSRYGFRNAREFVAEAMSNPQFAVLLAHVGLNGEIVTNPKSSILKNIYDALVDMINKAIKGLSEAIGVTISKIEKLDNTYLGYLINELDNAILNTEKIDLSNTDIFNTSTESQQLAKQKNSSKAAERIVNTAIARNYSSLSQLKELVAEVEKGLGGELKGPVKAAITRRFKTYLNKKNLVGKSKEILDKASKSERYEKSPAYENIVDALAKVKGNELKGKELDSYANALEAVLSGSEKQLIKAKQFAQKYTASKAVEEITNKEKGMGFKDFDKGVRGLLKNWVNFPTFLAYISKYNKEKAPILMKHFHNTISSPYTKAQVAMSRYMDDLNKAARENKLTEKNFNRIYYYGIIKRQGLDSIADERRYLQNKLEAVEKGYDKRFDAKEVANEIAEFDAIAKLMAEDKQVLTTEEQAYYDQARLILEQVRPGVADNTRIVWEEDYKDEQDYIPSLSLGSIPVEVGEAGTGAITNSTVGEKNLVDVLNYELSPKHGNLASVQSQFTYRKRGAKGTYYDTNLHTVMAKYLNSTLFDLYGTYNIQTLNKQLKSTNRGALDSELGVANMKIVKDALERAIRYAIRPTPKYSDITRSLMKIKNRIQAGRIGTQGQFFTQYFGMWGAIMAATSPKAFGKALSTQAKLFANSVKRSEFEQKLKDVAGEIGIRDFWFEKYESPEDIARKGFAGRLSRFSEDIEKNTVTKMLSLGDKWSAQLTWLAAFIEVGGSIDDQKSWEDADKIAAADLKVAQIQNVSSGLFAPEVLYKDTEKAALIATALWSFKSFALNSMSNFWLAAPNYFKNEGARKITNGIVTGALGYEAFSLATRWVYDMLSNLVSPDDDKEDDEFWEQKAGKYIYKTAYDLLFSGLPSIADSFLQTGLTNFVNPFIFGDKKKFHGKTKITFDTYKDNPIYGGKNAKDATAKTLGPFEQLVINGYDGVDLIADELQGKDVTPERKSNTIGKVVAEIITMAKFIPFRGDIARLTRNSIRNKGKQKRKKRRTNQIKIEF